jgi:hypothetical protein
LAQASPRTARSRPSLRAIDTQQRGASTVSSLDLGLIEQPTRPRSEITMGVRKAALDLCEQGVLREAADITRAAMTESGYARGILSDLTHGLWSLPHAFIGDPEMIAALDDSHERIGQWRVMFPEPDVIRLLSWGITLGVGIGQMRRKYTTADAYPLDLAEAADGYHVPVLNRPIGAHDTRILRTWDPKYLRHQWWDDTWWLMTADGEIRITPNDGEWILYCPFGSQKPWEYGTWRSLTRAFVVERDAIFDQSRHAEVLAPLRVGKVPQGTTERQRKKYLDQIRAMKRMGVFVLPPGLEYTIVESTSKIADIYSKIIQFARDEYAMQSGVLTTATGSPGFSKGDVQERFTRAILSSLGGSLAATFYNGALVQWGQENYGREDAPRVEIDTAAPEDKKARAETIKTAGEALVSLDAGLAKAGLHLSVPSVVKFAQSLGFEVEAIPAGSAPVAKLTLGVEAINGVVRGGEARQSQGLPLFGDERDDMTIADLLGQASGGPAQPLPAPSAPPSDDAPQDVGLDDGEAPPTEDSAAVLAAKMSQHAVDRCEHGSNNRCLKCGIERTRDFTPGKRGQPVKWTIAWKPIAVRAYSNGSNVRPLFAIGGDA